MNPTHRAISLLSNLWFPPHSWLRKQDKCRQESGLWLVHHPSGSPNAGPENRLCQIPQQRSRGEYSLFPTGCIFRRLLPGDIREVPSSYPSAISQTLRPLLGKCSGPLLPASASQFLLVPLPTVVFADLPPVLGLKPYCTVCKYHPRTMTKLGVQT